MGKELTALEALKTAQQVFKELAESSKEELTIGRCRAAVNSLGNVIKREEQANG